MRLLPRLYFRKSSPGRLPNPTSPGGQNTSHHFLIAGINCRAGQKKNSLWVFGALPNNGANKGLGPVSK